MTISFVWAPWYVLAFVLLAIGGCGQAGFSTMQSTITMLAAPPTMRGRMMGLLSVCIGAATPLGTLALGVMAAMLSIPQAITLNAVVGLLLLWPAVVWTPLVWCPLTSQPATTSPAET
jgi:MFS family permease